MAEDLLDPPAQRDEWARHARDLVRYALALAGYIAIGAITKNYLSFTWGLLYFVTVLDFVPRLFRRLRDRRVDR